MRIYALAERGLVKLLWYMLTRAWLWKRSLGDGVGTVLVNAAAVAGVKDDQKKGAIVVEICVAGDSN